MQHARSSLFLSAAAALSASMLLFACDRNATGPEAHRSAAPSLATSQATVATCGEETDVRLLAGRHIHAGTVTVGNDHENLYVTYATSGDWKLHETRVAAGDSKDAIPTNRAGNPRMGQFPYTEHHDPVETGYTYTIPFSDLNLDAGDDAYIAAHAELNGEGAWAEGAPISDQSGNWTMYFTHTVVDCAVATLGSSGGTVQTSTGTATLQVPQGSLIEPTEITVEQTSTTEADVIEGTVFEFGPAGLQFDPPADLSIVIEKSAIPSEVDLDDLRLVYVTSSGIEAIPGSGIDPGLTTQTTVTIVGEVSHFSVIGAAEADDPAGEANLFIDVDSNLDQNGDIVTIPEAHQPFLVGIPVQNKGPDPVTGVKAEITISGDLAEVNVTGAVVSVGGVFEPCSSDDGIPAFAAEVTVTCPVGALDDGQIGSVNVLLESEAQTVTVDAAITDFAGATDPDVADNEATLAISVVCSVCGD